MRKAAVIIGVDKTGMLPRLKSAAEGAQRFAAWLANEGFEVACITDQLAPVTCAQVVSAIESFVTLPPRYHMVLVYFSGHGYWQARSDVWLLSGAPTRTEEAISLEAAIDLAKYSGVPNVVFVSDACRSIPNSRAGVKVSGSGVFPNYDEIDVVSKIDYFKATGEALPAYEVTLDGRPQSVLTAALRSAYEEPEAHMVREISEGSETIQIVPNRRLEDYLQKKIDAILDDVGSGLLQRVEVSVPSSDDVYLARVRRPLGAPREVRAPTVGRAVQSTPDSGRLSAEAIGRALVTPSFAGSSGGIELQFEDKVTERGVQSRLPHQRVDHFETQAGFVVQGARVGEAIAAGDQLHVRAQLLPSDYGSAQPGLVRVDTERVLSVALRLESGRCVVLACLPGYIGHVTFGDGGVSNVSYVPSSNNWRWSEYEQRRGEIDRLRATVAMAVDKNSFRVQSIEEAEALAARIRMGKSIDPTLGLYAAYAFSQAGNQQQLVSVQSYMRGDLRADLFDIRLLAERDPTASNRNVPVVPLCPMLTQSWHLLRARRVTLPQALREASSYLCDSLWTTFEPAAADAIMDAFRQGAYQ